MKLKVDKDLDSTTGYSLRYGGVSIPARSIHVQLWRMYIEAIDLAQRLHDELVELAKVEIGSKSDE